MKYRVAVIACMVAVAVVAVVATVVDEHNGESSRVVQHEVAQQLADLPEAERAAASSTSTAPDEFASHLPVLAFDTHGQQIPGQVYYNEQGHRETGEGGRMITTLADDGNDYITAALDVHDATGQANRLADDPAISTQAQISLRGNTSRRFDKKSYHIRLVDEDGADAPAEFLGMDRGDEWVLHGPFLDKTLLRNYLTYNVAGLFMSQYVPDVRFCEVFLDGAYQGLYLAVEPIDVGNGRVNLNKAAQGDTAVSYLAAIDMSEEAPTTVDDFLHYTLRMSNYITVNYPTSANLTETQRTWIENDLSSIEKALFSYDYDSPKYGYTALLDVSSFVDMYLLNEFAINDDFGAYSTYLYKDIRGKLTLGPPWDYNNCYDNYKAETSAEGFYQVERVWYFMLFKDETYCERTISRYRQLRASVLSEENLDAFIDAAVAYLGPAVERNFSVWGYSFDASALRHYQKLEPDERNPQSHEAAIEQLKGFIHERGSWLDANIDNLRQYSHESVVKKFNQ